MEATCQMAVECQSWMEVGKRVHGLRFYAATGPGLLQDLRGDVGQVSAKASFVT